MVIAEMEIIVLRVANRPPATIFRQLLQRFPFSERNMKFFGHWRKRFRVALIEIAERGIAKLAEIRALLLVSTARGCGSCPRPARFHARGRCAAR